jgi:hypothetical protein
MLSNQATDKLNTDKFNFPVDLLNIKTDTISGTNNTYKELRIPKNIGRAVIRKDTDEAIAIVGKDYHLVPHQDLFEEVTHQLEMSDRSFDDIEVIDNIYNKGAIVKRTIVCRDDKYKVAIPTKGKEDYQHLRLDVYNSYDMSMGFHFVIGGYGHYCSNLQVFQGKAFVQHYGKHTINLNAVGMVKDIGNLVDNYMIEASRMSHWGGVELREDWVVSFLKSTICKSSQHNAEKVNIKRLNMFTHLYNEEAKRWGYTLWSLYNALTHWATHDVDNKARTPKYQINRQVELRNKVFKSNSWNNLVAVA